MKKTLVTFLLTFSFATNASNSFRDYTNSSSNFYQFGYDNHFNSIDGKFVHLGYQFLDEPLIIKDSSNDSKLGSVIDSANILYFGFYYRKKRWSFGLSSKLLHLNMGKNFSKDTSSTHLGDTHLDLTYELFNKKRSTLGINVEVGLPTGREDYFSSYSSLLYGSHLYYSRNWSEKLSSSLSLGYAYSKDAAVSTFDFSKQVVGKWGIAYKLSSKSSIGLEGIKRWTLPSNSNLNPNELNLFFNKVFKDSIHWWIGAGSSSFGSSSDSQEVRVFTGVKFNLYHRNSLKNKDNEFLTGGINQERKPAHLIQPFEREINFSKNLFRTVPRPFYNKLNSVVEFVKNNSNKINSIILQGHSSLDEINNKKLSQERAEVVKRYMLSKGIDENILRAISYGPEKDYDNNRKVVIKILTQD